MVPLLHFLKKILSHNFVQEEVSISKFYDFMMHACGSVLFVFMCLGIERTYE